MAGCSTCALTATTATATAAATAPRSRGSPSAASVAHLLDQWARARKAPPPLDPVLPADPRVRDLRVTPHALARYDELYAAPPRPDGAMGPGKRTLTMGIDAGAPGGGAPLPEAVKARMERTMGADFSAVRIHQGSEAAAMGALAFTRGNDIHFAPGQYDPDSAQGQELLGHELAHVVQQPQGRVPGGQDGAPAIHGDHGLEHEADQLGVRAARGEPAAASSAPIRTAGAATTAVQRKLVPNRTTQDQQQITYHDDRDTWTTPQLVFGDNGVQQFVFLGSWQVVNLLNDTDQYMIGNDHHLDPETHQLLTQAPGDLYQDHARVQYQYIDRRYRRLDRLTPQEAIALDTKTIDQQSRNLSGIWVIGTVFVNNILFRRTAPYRSGTPEIENNPYRTDHLEGKGHDHDEVDMSTTDAEADLMFELEAIVNEQIGRWSQTRQGALIEIAITGTFGPCNECKGRIQALIDQVRQHATDTERIRRQFAARPGRSISARKATAQVGPDRPWLPIPGQTGFIVIALHVVGGKLAYTHTPTCSDSQRPSVPGRRRRRGWRRATPTQSRVQMFHWAAPP